MAKPALPKSALIKGAVASPIYLLSALTMPVSAEEIMQLDKLEVNAQQVAPATVGIAAQRAEQKLTLVV